MSALPPIQPPSSQAIPQPGLAPQPGSIKFSAANTQDAFISQKPKVQFGAGRVPAPRGGIGAFLKDLIRRFDGFIERETRGLRDQGVIRHPDQRYRPPIQTGMSPQRRGDWLRDLEERIANGRAERGSDMTGLYDRRPLPREGSPPPRPWEGRTEPRPARWD